MLRRTNSMHKKQKQYKNKKTQKQLKPEIKYLITAATSAANSTGVVVLLNAVPKGDDENQRIGRSLSPTSLKFSGFTSVTPGTGVDQVHRHMIVWDRFPNGATPAITDILLANNVYSFPDPINSPRFQILSDRIVSLNATAEAGSIRVLRASIPLRGTVFYNENSLGDIRDILTGALFLIVIGTSAAGVTAGTTNWNAKFSFTDV